MTPLRTFWSFFVLGCAVVLLDAFGLGGVPGVHALLSLLATAGVALTLPFHNIMPGGGLGVVALITLGNGLACGIVAGLVVSKRNRGW